MDREIEKITDSTIMEAKRFIQQHKPPAPRDKLADFLGYTRRRVSDLLTWFIHDKTGVDVSGIKPRKRDVPRPEMQIR